MTPSSLARVVSRRAAVRAFQIGTDAGHTELCAQLTLEMTRVLSGISPQPEFWLCYL